jgi:hypothetical protein
LEGHFAKKKEFSGYGGRKLSFWEWKHVLLSVVEIFEKYFISRTPERTIYKKH